MYMGKDSLEKEKKKHLKCFKLLIKNLNLELKTQPTFTCSELIIENLVQGVNICLKLTIKIPERRHGVALVFSLLSLNIFHTLF